MFEVTCAHWKIWFLFKIQLISLFQSYTNFVFDRIELTAIFVTHDTLIYFSRAHDFEPWFLLSPFFSHCHARFKIPGYYTISHRFYLCMFELAFLYSRLLRLFFSFNSLLEFEFQAILAWSHNCLFVFTHWISLSHPDATFKNHKLNSSFCLRGTKARTNWKYLKYFKYFLHFFDPILADR